MKAWYKNKIAEHQSRELAAKHVGDDSQAKIESSTIEHYQELLNNQRDK